MSSARPRMRVGAIMLLGSLLLGLDAPPARADNPPASRPFPRPSASGRRGEGLAEKSGGWWFGTAGIALALALFGGISMASRRFLPRAGSGGSLGVVGRVRLSPKHTVYLLKVGERVLLLGAGPQGSPSLLGELTEPADLRRFAPRRPDPSSPDPVPEGRGFDRLLGDEE